MFNKIYIFISTSEHFQTEFLDISGYSMVTVEVVVLRAATKKNFANATVRKCQAHKLIYIFIK
jgi:hypothetical protein